MVFPKSTELAVLTVNGEEYQDWETVEVTHQFKDFPFFMAKFTTSEGTPFSKNFAALQVKPGDFCTVTLAGQPAFTGKVEIRQVYADARRHHVELTAISRQEIATASVISQTMQWKDRTFGAIARDILGKMNIAVRFEGGAEPSFKFERASAHHGQPVLEFLDELSRGLPATNNGISFTSNINGDFCVILGPLDGQDSVIEGQNALILRELIYNIGAAGTNPGVGQRPANNQIWGANVSHSPFAGDSIPTFGAGFMPGVIVNEIPAWSQSLLKGRVGNEGQWQGSDQITAIVTVQGWLRPTGGLWLRGQNVSVTSPMLIMDGQVLQAKTIVFTQDNQGGTRTTLTLCNALAMGKVAPGVGTEGG